MARFEKKFFRMIYRNNGGFLPTWPLGQIINLGDIVYIRRKRMDYQGNVGELGIQVQEDADVTGEDAKWQSRKGVNISTKAQSETPAKGSHLPQSKSGISLDFTRKSSFLFEPKNIRYNRIKNLFTVRAEILKQISQNALQLDLRKAYFVTQIAKVDAYSLAISINGKGKLEVSSDLESKMTTADLSRADIGLKTEWESELGFNVIGKEGGAIFFKAEKLRLKPDVKDKILESNPRLISLPEAELLSYTSTNEIENAFDFVELNLDDLNEFTGEWDDEDEDDL